MKSAHKKFLFIIVSFFILIFCILAGISIGSTFFSFQTTFSTFIKIFFHFGTLDNLSIQHKIIFLVRTPRVLVGALVGASLAIAGVQMQGLFQNSLASPDVIGTSSGGALGAVIAIACGLASRSIFYLPILAFTGATLSTFFIYILSTYRAKTSISSLLLTGMAINSLTSAAISLIITSQSRYGESASEIFSWLFGGLESRMWIHVLIIFPVFLIGILIANFYARDLDMLAVGEEQASSLGVDLQRVKRNIMISTSLLTGVSVAVSGVIGFVGLIIPHIVRLILGPTHRFLIFGSALTGASFLILADIFARTITFPSEVRIGIITSIIGAPFFLFLLTRQRKEV